MRRRQRTTILCQRLSFSSAGVETGSRSFVGVMNLMEQVAGAGRNRAWGGEMDKKAMHEISEPCGRRQSGGIWSLLSFNC